ncbi:MAG TPA: hypothetical protein VKY31_13130, partial [Terriglobia bacterium]|nr:hypothetical protein [Terriglobia bacterium]
LLFALAVVCARAKVNLYRGSTISFLTCVVILAVIREGPAVAMLVGIAGVTVQTFFPSRKLVLHQLAFNIGMIALTVLATWSTYHLLVGRPGIETLPTELTATILASFMYFLGNSISVSLIVSLSQGAPMLHLWSTHFLHSAPSFVIAGLVSLGVVGLAGNIVLIGVALVAVTMIAYYCSISKVAA